VTREHWRTKLRRRPRRGAESLRSSHPVDSVGVERRVSPPPRRWGACQFLESFEWETTVEMSASPRGAPATILAVPPPRIDARAYLKGDCLQRFFRRRNFERQCSRVILADSLQNRAFGRFEGPKFWRFAREGLFRYTPTGLYRLFSTVSICRARPSGRSCTVLYRQSGTWSDYTESKLASSCMPIRTRAIRPTGRFDRINFPNQTCLRLYLELRVSKSRFS